MLFGSAVALYNECIISNRNTLFLCIVHRTQSEYDQRSEQNQRKYLVSKTRGYSTAYKDTKICSIKIQRCVLLRHRDICNIKRSFLTWSSFVLLPFSSQFLTQCLCLCCTLCVPTTLSVISFNHSNRLLFGQLSPLPSLLFGVIHLTPSRQQL